MGAQLREQRYPTHRSPALRFPRDGGMLCISFAGRLPVRSTRLIRRVIMPTSFALVSEEPSVSGMICKYVPGTYFIYHLPASSTLENTSDRSVHGPVRTPSRNATPVPNKNRPGIMKPSRVMKEQVSAWLPWSRQYTENLRFGG
jgi:hypothetical protein